ncbi:MAG: GTP-binding protein [Mesorhizobium sp.]|uniref:CobW family GTP-binding protein n=1 Tax=Mesorhizobium sp. TaxID=1871066 RepID=UPI001AC3AE4C|nr:GTP-binding protein [Mesorhizobium sp.]MBN9223057.1 GTP-binding protein [Mesorhizobium sp.]
MAQKSNNRIPATVVTGFLGSGKTTLINNILHKEHGKNIAVIVNEFGEISIDGQLVVRDDQAELIEFNNGCLCCTVRGDLIETLQRLHERAGKLDGILIETTGLADPAPVASTFFVADEVKNNIQLDAFVTLVDAVNLEMNLSQSTEAVEQVAFSDIVLINKIDLVTPDRLKVVEAKVRALNPLARIRFTTNAEIDIDQVIGVGAFDLVQKLDVDPGFLEDHEHEHDQAVGSFILEETRPIDLNRFSIWLNEIAQTRGQDLYRTKGIFHARGFRERIVFQSVRMLTTMRPDRIWGDNERRLSQFVVIGKNLDREEFAKGFEQCLVS